MSRRPSALGIFCSAISTLALALAACGGGGGHPDRLAMSAPTAAGSLDFLRAVSGTLNVPIRRGGALELLVNGDRFFPALLRAIDEARASVHVTTYVWEPGEMSDRMLAALERAAARGVEVRLLLDGHGARNLPDDDLEGLEASGGHVAVFRPIRPGWPSRINQRSHRRAFVIDGEIGFTGGASIGDQWLGDARNTDEWRDDLVRVSGALARSLQAAFTELWVRTTGEVPTGAAVYPDNPPEEAGAESVALHVSVVATPALDHAPLRTLFWLSFAGARERIWITNPYVVPHESIRRILCERARDGIDVRILTAGQHTDIPPVLWAARHRYDELLEAGIHIYEYQPTLVHSKLLLVDDVWSLVGSGNLDFRSSELNEENVLAIQDTGFAEQLEAVFLSDLERAEEIDLTAWRERSVVLRVREWIGSLIEEQL